MAKTLVTAVTPAADGRRRRKLAEATPADAQPSTMSPKTKRLIDGIRDEFDAFAGGFAQLEHDRASLAPKFMKAFDAWQKDTQGTFIGFVRVLAPSVPEGRDDYRAHPTYQAADYLRRLMSQATRERAEVPEEERPRSAYQALVALVATVLPAVDPTGTIWTAFVKAMNWSAEQSERVKVAAAKVGPVALPPRVKGQLTHLRGAA